MEKIHGYIQEFSTSRTRWKGTIEFQLVEGQELELVAQNNNKTDGTFSHYNYYVSQIYLNHRQKEPLTRCGYLQKPTLVPKNKTEFNQSDVRLGMNVDLIEKYG